jgi:formate C-acetyltransferase
MKSAALKGAAGSVSRVAALRNRIINAPQEVCVERARYLTESMRQNWDSHPLARISMALDHILQNISVIIREGELIVGCRTSKLKGAPLFPENKIRWIEGDVDNFAIRVMQRALITEEEQRELKETIIPFWKGKSVEEYFETLLPEDVTEDIDKYIFTMMLEINYGIGHFTMNYPEIFSMGLRGIIDRAKKMFMALSDGEKSSEKGIFYESVIRSLNAAITFARRYAALAESMANAEGDPVRKDELLKIAAVCGRVPENPPESFHEAVQSLYFIHLVAQIESGGNSISLGRIDQILYPYFIKDIKENRITPDRARELLSLLYLKTNEIWNVLEEAYIAGGEGPEGKTTQNVTLGGLGAPGSDATNELSYIALDAYADVRTVQPNMSLRFSEKSPEDFFLRAAEYTKDGVLLHFFNDDAVIPSLMDSGHSEADAVNYALVGCVEPNAQGKTFGSTFAVQFSGIKCLEFALSNGVDNIFGYQSGIKTGDPAGFTSMEEVWKAYDGQMSHYMGQIAKGMNALDTAIAEMLPSPFASAMIDGPLEKGMDLTRGGAVYNSTGVQFIGFSNVVDSLYAVEKAVFKDKKLSMEELVEHLENDWMDAETTRSYMARKVNKYGNDQDDVDEMGSRVLNHYCDLLAQHKNFRGGYFWPGVFSVGFHLAFGSFTGATPDGRIAGAMLGNGITPSNSAVTHGPTAVMNSVSKLPIQRVYNGLNLNMRFSGKWLKAASLKDLIRGYFDRGGIQVQFNMVDREILEEAQKHPEQYRDLVVRISGYSAVFINLSDTAQEDIINRTQYTLN